VIEKLFPYPSRPGLNIQPIVEALDQDIEATLTPEQYTDVLQFERALYEGQLPDTDYVQAKAYLDTLREKGEPLVGLEAMWSIKVKETNLGVGYFLTDEGRKAYQKAFGSPLVAEGSQECERRLRTTDLSNIPTKVLDKLEGESVGFEEKRIVNEFAISNFSSASEIEAPQILELIRNPEALVDKVKGYRQFKDYIRAVQRDLRSKPEANETRETKLTVVALYRRRLNYMLAELYVDSHKLLLQYQATGSPDALAQITEIKKSLPALIPDVPPSHTARFLQKMDRFRRGVARDNDGLFTWLSQETQDLASGKISDRTQEPVDRGDFSDVDRELLEEVEIDGATFQEWVNIVLEEYGLLSAYTEYDSDRPERAPDDKWQAVLLDKFTSLAVNSQQGVVKIPTKSISVLKAIVLTNHEIVHLLQHENKKLITDLALIKKIGIDEASDQAEAGGLWQEKLAEEALTGQPDIEVVDTSYLRALEVKSRGGTFGECMQAFFEDFRKLNPKMSLRKVAERAVNRTRRIFRYGGEFAYGLPELTNTQPLYYLEQQLIYENLPEDKKKLLLIGRISLENLVELRNTGLVNLDHLFVPEKMPWQILAPVVKQYLKRPNSLPRINK